MDGGGLFFSLALAGLFGLPGWWILHVFFPADDLGILERIPLAFTLGLGLFLFIFLAALGLTWDWQTLELVWSGIVVGLGISAFVLTRARPRHDAPRARFDLPTVILLLGLLVAAGLTLVTPRDEDDWSYFPHVRSFVDATHFPPLDLTRLRTGLNVWWFFHAFLARALHLDIVHIGQDYIPFWMVPLALLASYGLARALGAHRWLATLVPLAQLAFFFFDLGYAQPGVQLAGGWVLGRIDQDHTVAGFVFLPVYSMTVLRYLQSGARRWLWLSFLCLIVLSNVHPQGLVWAAILLGPFLFIEIFFLPARARYRSLWAWTPFLVALLLTLPFIVFWTRFVQTPYFDQTRLVEGINDFPYHFRWFEFFSRTVFTLRHDLLGLPYALGALLVLPALARRYRHSMTARYLVTAMLVLGLILYVPLLFMPLSRWLGYSIFRLWYLLPSVPILCFAFPDLWDWLKQGVHEFRAGRVNRQVITAGAMIGGLVLLFSRFPGYVSQSPLEALTGHALPAGAHEILRALGEQHVAVPVTVLAPREISDPIPTFNSNLTPLVFRYFADPQSVAEVTAFYAAIVVTTEHVALLTQHRIGYLIAPTDKQIISQFDLAPVHFTPIHRNRAWGLYRVNQPLDDDALTLANTRFIHGEWQGALDAYDQVLAADPANSLAHTGRGMVFELLGRPNRAIQEFEHAVRLAPTNQQAHYHLALIYQRLGMTPQAEEHARAAGALVR